MKVKITIAGIWKDTIGVIEGFQIPGTKWFNVRVSPQLRLVLTMEEFVIV